MSGVAAPLTVEVNRGVAGVIRGLLFSPILGLEALVAGPRSIRVAVNREVLTGEQISAAGLSQHFSEQRLDNLSGQQLLAVLGEYRHVPQRIVAVHFHKPAKQQIVAQLLHQHLLAAHASSP